MIIVGVILVGFTTGYLMSSFKDWSWACTEMACLLEEGTDSGEYACNSCIKEETIFVTGILNVIKHCDATEMVKYENGRAISSRVDVENKICYYKYHILGLDISYLFSNPEQAVTSG